jgi:hypothetical protein
MTRADHEPPLATKRWGWRYHHTGIPTDQPREGEQYLAAYKLYRSGFPESPYGIEWMRFEPGSPVHELVKTLPHLAFEVDDIDEALKGKTVLSAPGSPSDGVRSAMILDNGSPIELIEFRGGRNETPRSPQTLGLCGDNCAACPRHLATLSDDPREKAVDNCGLCAEYPCRLISAAFASTDELRLHVARVCGPQELTVLEAAFLFKRRDLDRVHREWSGC